MNRRKFFARMTQGVAAAVLATHLSFGNLVPIPVAMQDRFKWVKLVLTFVPDPNSTIWTSDMSVSDVTEAETIDMLEHYVSVGKQRVEKFPDRQVEYLKVTTDGNRELSWEECTKEYGFMDDKARPKLNFIGA